MFDFHTDKARYFNMQYQVTKDYVIPFLEDHIDLNRPMNVLEIGCAEAGVLKAFLERGHDCTGIELSEHRVKLARQFFEKEIKEKKIRFISRNIYDIDPVKDLADKFDLIILKDVIEHIHDQHKFMQALKSFLKPNGKVFFGFPPWQMPFGGHQQICQNKYLSKLPYFHLLPKPLYRGILKLGKESEGCIEDLIEIKDTGISIERFQKILKDRSYTTLKKELFLFNPIYEYKFNLKPKKQLPVVKGIPIVRNYVSTCAYYLVAPQE